jgi:tetratricopeptide (TPR) repeat protein
MIDLRPDIATYARVSYAQELQGNIPDAIKGMQLAYQSSGTAADAAWASYYLGELYFNSGRLDAADREYRRGVALDGAFIPNHQGIAKVEAARGQTDAAIRDYRWVVERYPLPSYVIELGDLYMVTGQADQAAQQYALVKAERQLFQANGVNMDLDIALFDADHGVDLAEGLAAARAEWDRRQSVLVADALGWSLYANGQFREALTYAERSLELGTRSALFLFHKGTIEKALGRTGAARRDLAAAIDINPSFSILWSRSAAEALASLGGAP